METIYKELNKLISNVYLKDDIIAYIKHQAHEHLIQSSIDKDKIEELIEDCRYEEAISKLQSIIEWLEGGYCVILDKIEGKR
jgi:hypothetical protein